MALKNLFYGQEYSLYSAGRHLLKDQLEDSLLVSLNETNYQILQEKAKRLILLDESIQFELLTDDVFGEI